MTLGRGRTLPEMGANRSASTDGGVRSNPESVIVAIATALHRRRAT
jgi:hypothetical protein